MHARTYCLVAIASWLGINGWAADLKEYAPRVSRNLTNIIRFWHPVSVDRENGGYLVNLDERGRPAKAQPKMIVTQARMLWFYSHLARNGYQPAEFLRAAETGYRFLTERMWDADFGGFYWEVDVTGRERIQPKKHLYGQAFALYAISEYYLATQRSEALEFARKFFRLLEAKSHDRIHGGYVEFFDRDWSEPAAGEVSYMGEPQLKLMNTHLHLMEAMTAYYRASQDPVARERLLELITIESNTVVRKDLGACSDKYARDWTPRLDGNYARVSYGHDLENIWLLIDACQAADVPVGPYQDLFRTLWQYAMRYGYDAEEGGFYDSGLFGQRADRRQKVWWVQAEVIVCALYLHRLTGEEEYAEVFRKTFDFIEKNLTDWEHGDWFQEISANGQVDRAKGHRWKAAYHNGRAMVECLRFFRPSKQ